MRGSGLQGLIDRVFHRRHNGRRRERENAHATAKCWITAFQQYAVIGLSSSSWGPTLKQDETGAPISANGWAQVSELSVFDTATPAMDRRASERDGPSRRGGPRVEVEAAVRLRGAAQGAVDARIFNLSAGGCGLVLKSGMFNAGDLVTIKIEGVEHWPGTVQWCVGQEAGIAFDRPFYPAVFDAVVAIHKEKLADTAS